MRIGDNPHEEARRKQGALGGQEAIDYIVEHATKDRYALIIPETWEPFVVYHVEQLMKAHQCTGILVRQSTPGCAYHVLRTDCYDKVCAHGVDLCTNEWATFGNGVIYAYPTPAQTALCKNAYGVVRIEYSPGTLRSIYTEDKEENMQGEILIPPECVVRQVPYRRREPNDTDILKLWE